MPRARTSLQLLGRLLEEVTEPIYVVDDRRRIAFCNAAARQWLGPAAEALVGERCDYHSGAAETPAAQLACALCPPPEAFAGARRRARLCVALDAGACQERTAEFLPLPVVDGAGVLVIVDGETQRQGDLPSPEAQAEGEGSLQGTSPSPCSLPEGEGFSGSPVPLTLREGSPAAEDEPAELHAAIARFRHQQRQRYAFERLVGTSAASARARAQAALAAASDASVLVVGPPGSGKQHLARSIHQRRCAGRQGQIVPLACALLGADLLRSTLAALAAQRAAPADGPVTLLLNQVDQLPSEVQPDLYRLLAAGNVPLGVIATSTVPLDSLAAEGKSLPDLAHLVATLVIELPPLAARLEDLPLLAQLFLEDKNAVGGKQVGGFTSEALDALAAHAWPANLDELAAIVSEAHKQAEGPLVAEADLPRRMRLASEAAAHSATADDLVVLDEFLRDVERELIGRALARAKGNKARAARLLGLTRPRLYRRLVELGMEE